jgi:cation diffusion facilitator CzcD-associated flavoprotein CzcO/predicted ATP-grasp superfamily ATP-dependent carboligase
LAIMMDRILVTDAETRAGVAVARGLHEVGFQVTAAAGSSARPVASHWSRSVHERLLVPHPLEDEAGFLDAVERAVLRGGYSVLVPGSDASLLAISGGRDRLEPHVRIGLPPHELVERSLDKLALISAASHHQLTSPLTISCHGAADAVAAAERLGFPVVLKPVRSIFEVDGVWRRARGMLVPDERALEGAVADYGDPCLVQRRERGVILSFAGVFANGCLLGEALSRYHRTWRPDSGSASFSQTIETPLWLRERAAALLKEIGWVGLFELELIEREKGLCAAIDLNPRPYGSLALAIGAGANLPAIWCEQVLAREPERARARPGVFYRWEEADLRYALWQLRHRKILAAARVLRLRRGVVHPYFASRDPGPFVAEMLVLAKSARSRAEPIPRATTEPDVRDPTAVAPARRARRTNGSAMPVVIIGAGPYGLAAAAHLRAAGFETRCFGEPLEFWRRQMPAGMVLRSRKRSSHIADPRRELAIEHYEQAEGKTVHTPSLLLEEFVDYGLWFQQRAVSDLDPRKVATVSRNADGFRVALEDGEELRAGRVVVAAGLSPFPHRPEPFASLPTSLQSHTSEHADLGVLSGKRVLVIGAGQSALESAALLHERGASVEVLARAPSIWWLGDGAAGVGAARRPRVPIPLPPTDVGGRLTGWIAAAPDVFRRVPSALQPTVSERCIRPAGSGWLRPRLADVTVSYERFVIAAQQRNGEAHLVLDDGSERTVDHVLLGTGYTIDVTRYAFIAPELAAGLRLTDGYPVLGPGLESSVPGLHFLGAPAALSFGPIMRFIVGTWYAAPALTRRALGRAQPPIRFSF